jgi:D-glycero-D-manno-heptose 1,7-bisphosphate phosphatase
VLVNNRNEFEIVEFVFLDRDGVINRKPPRGGFVTCWEEFDLLPEVPEAIAALNRAGRKVLVVTNQRGVALGLYSLDELSKLHERMQKLLAARGAHVDGIYVCPHEAGQCECRKPQIGLFEQAFRDFPNATPANSVVIGDSLRDIEAGRKLGMRTILIGDNLNGSDTELQRARSLADLTLPSLAEFVRQCITP